MNMQPLADQRDRDRFIKELDTNFCVSASAGAGKTTAIVRRIVELACREEDIIAQGKESRLSRLVVVTYGVLAAEELRVRARQEMFRNLSADTAKRQFVLAEFNRAYFGTIHSFCLKLLQEEGRHLGLPANLELLDDQDERLWQRFAESDIKLPAELSRENITQVFRHYHFEEILELARQMKPDDAEDLVIGKGQARAPQLDCTELLSFVPNKRAEKNVRKHQEHLQRWLRNLTGDEGYLELPEYKTGGAEFLSLFRDTFSPYVAWLNAQASLLAAHINLDYRDYRVSQGCLTYQDMIVWAKKLLDEPKILRRLRERNYTVILDEAQDTDPAMFTILTELTRPLESEVYAWPQEPDAEAPMSGRFSFVGDDQQMIYSDRANLRKYHQYISAFREGRGGEELDFSVTMRCPQSVIGAVNRIFPQRLDQNLVKFKPLVAKPDAGIGNVRILPLDIFHGEKVEQQFEEECAQVVAWLKSLSWPELGISNWSELAVLAPRVSWLSAAADIFRKAGFPVRVISSKARRADMPAYSWPTALLQVLLHPYDRFELIGVLREVYGISDAELLEVHRAGCGLNLFSEAKNFTRTAQALAQLRNLQELLAKGQQAGSLRLGMFAQELLQVTQLRERIAASKGETEFLDDFIRSALTAEMEGMDTLSWLELLKRELEKEPPQAIAGANEIQFLTGQKAKGLEWPVVLLLGFGRRIGFKTAVYPRMEKSEEGICIHFSDLTRSEAAKDAQDLARDQELQRLFYVMMTRAKRMLVLPDSSGLYGKGEPKFSSLLHWAEIQLTDSGEKPDEVSVKQEGDLSPDGKLAELDVSAAIASAKKISNRILPHTLATHPEPDEERQFDQDNLVGGLEYGTWWHGVLQYFPWSSTQGEQDAYIHEQLNTAPPLCRERGGKELGLFLRSEFRRQLYAKGEVFLAELPFLTAVNTDEAMEGVIDLLVTDKDGGCMVLDWKTNRPYAQESNERFCQRLRQIYERQLQAYAGLLSKQFERKISGCWLYATATGSIIEINAS